MIVDSSAIVAILRKEQEADEFKELIGHAEPKLSAVTLLESSIVVGPLRHAALDELVADAEMRVVPFDAEQATLARTAYARFGKGSSSRARLNFGDCAAYALSALTGEPLLFKGDDFTHTDVNSAR